MNESKTSTSSKTSIINGIVALQKKRSLIMHTINIVVLAFSIIMILLGSMNKIEPNDSVYFSILFNILGRYTPIQNKNATANSESQTAPSIPDLPSLIASTSRDTSRTKRRRRSISSSSETYSHYV